MNIAHLDSWRSPATDYPRVRRGCAKIVRRRYNQGEFYDCYMVRGYEYYHVERRLEITGLTIDGNVWMVDDPPHWWAMEEHAAALSGHVLCAGLGLGLIVHALHARPEVERITVVERERDVIELVSPLVPQDKLQIIEGDFFEVGDDDLPPVDGVLFDLFVGDARTMMGAAMRAAMFCIAQWDRTGEMPVRVHGFANPLIEEMARGVLGAAEVRWPLPNLEVP